VLKHPTPYPSLDNLAQDFPSMLYWAERYAFLEMPGVQIFSSIPHLLWALNMGTYDLDAMSEEMRKESTKAAEEVIPFWAALMEELTTTKRCAKRCQGHDMPGDAVGMLEETSRNLKLQEHVGAFDFS